MKLDVIVVISNSARYKTRYRLFREFHDAMLKEDNVRLTVVELAFGDRPFEITDKTNPLHIQLRTDQELWHKENLWNIGFRSLPADAEYVAMVDADIRFVRPDWAIETIQQLQHNPVVQMFSQAVRLGPEFTQLGLAPSVGVVTAFLSSLPSFDKSIATKPFQFEVDGSVPYSAGLAWAYRKSLILELNGLLDLCVLGSADWHMAASFFNKAERSLPQGSEGAYFNMIMDWQKMAFPIVKGRVGYVNGLVFHFWHGNQQDRRYKERLAIVENIDPRRDLVRDWGNYGLLRLTDEADSAETRRHFHDYFRLRNEDSVNVEPAQSDEK